MPWGEIVTGVAGLGGALLGNNANKRAQQAQERSNREAMQYQRERDARADAKEAAAAKAARQHWEYTMDLRRDIAARHGVTLPDWRTYYGAGAGGPGGKTAAAPGSARGPVLVPGAPAAAGSPVDGAAMSIGNILGVTPGKAPMDSPVAGGMVGGPGGPTPGGPPLSGGNTLGDIADKDWSNWNRSLR